MHNTKDGIGQAEKGAKFMRGAIHDYKVWVKTTDLWERIYKLHSHFSLSTYEFMLLQRLAVSGEKKSNQTCISDARFESKQSLADSFGCSLAIIKDVEKRLRHKGLIISDGSAQNKRRRIALSWQVVEFICGEPIELPEEDKQGQDDDAPSERGVNDPHVGGERPPVDGKVGGERPPYSIHTRSIHSSRSTPKNILGQFYGQINKVTGPADSKAKNKPFRKVLDEFGARLFGLALDQLIKDGVKFVWHEPDNSGSQISSENIVEVLRAIIKAQPSA